MFQQVCDEAKVGRANVLPGLLEVDTNTTPDFVLVTVDDLSGSGP